MFFIVFPAGISQGFATIVLPYLLVHNGFSVAMTGGIVAIGVSANLWRFLGGPIVDITLSLKKWYWISVLLCTTALLALCTIPYKQEAILLITSLAFVSQVAATFLILPITGFMAKCIPHHQKGAASGWYQGGMLAATGLGGGVGLWLSVHYNMLTTGIVLTILSFAFALVISLIKDVHHDKQGTIARELGTMGKDILSLIKVPLALFTIILVCMPIGSGAASNLWSAIATEWHADADTVALTTGVVSGLVSTVGAVLGGYIVDRSGGWTGYMVSGIMCAVVALVMALMPFSPAVFIVGVLAYTFGIGMINAAFSAVILFAVGKKHAATKYSLLASFGNLPVVYMTAFDGWAHDRYNSKTMLAAEAVLGLFCVLVFSLAIRQMRARKLLVHSAE